MKFGQVMYLSQKNGLNMIWASLYVLSKLSGKLLRSIFAAKKSFNFLKKLKYRKLPVIRPGDLIYALGI